MLAWQSHLACPPTTWHCELGPQGDGMQGLTGSFITGSSGLAGNGPQRTKGSPVSSLGQLQIGL